MHVLTRVREWARYNHGQNMKHLSHIQRKKESLPQTHMSQPPGRNNHSPKLTVCHLHLICFFLPTIQSKPCLEAVAFRCTRVQADSQRSAWWHPKKSEKNSKQKTSALQKSNEKGCQTMCSCQTLCLRAFREKKHSRARGGGSPAGVVGTAGPAHLA